MKKFNLFLTMIIAVALIGLTNCKKESLNVTTPDGKKYVDAIATSFNVVPAVEITTKALTESTPTIPLVTQKMWMFTCNSVWYTINSENPFALVKGLEFIGGSAGQQFWSNDANNPASFPATTQVYSNLTPDEDVRVVVEGTDANGHIAYIGANDFNPDHTSFPLNILQYRLGDVLTINADAITSLPGVTSVNVSFDTKTFDLPATRICKLGIPRTALCFDDIVLGTTITNHVNVPVPVNSHEFSLCADVLNKVVGNIVITISAGGNPVAITLPDITATTCGHGMHIVLSTTKVGWFDSATMQMTPQDIDVTTTTVNVL